MDVKLHESWKVRLHEEFEKPYFKSLTNFVRTEYAMGEVYPPGSLIFNALDLCPFQEVKVVILGQDPYHGPGQAHGLCFSVRYGVQFPPSLRNIFKELKADVGKEIPHSGDLSAWCNQGVLLLNATLTVRAHEAGSHQNKGWEQFTDKIIELLNREHNHLVFVLWGAYAQKKGAIIDRSRHLVLESVHPSPLSASRGFFGNNHFSKANNYLRTHGKEAIVW